MLNYKIHGNGPENLVLLHGLMESTEVWGDLIPKLSGAFRIICIDLPGHGQSLSSADILTMEMAAEAVKSVLSMLKVDHFHLLGHSMGGYVTLAFAEKYPEMLRSITLFFSTFFADDEEKKNTRRKSFRIIEEEYPKYVNAGVPALFSDAEKNSLTEKISLARKIALNTSNKSALAAVKGIMERPDRRAVLEKFSGKVILIAGRHDNAVDSYKALQSLPDKKNIKGYLVDCGHNGHWEKPEICASVINCELLGGH